MHDVSGLTPAANYLARWRWHCRRRKPLSLGRRERKPNQPTYPSIAQDAYIGGFRWC